MTAKSVAPAAPLTPRASLRWPLIKRGMTEQKPATTLEIGCGQGAMGARLVGLTSSFLAVEPDKDSFLVAEERIVPRGGSVINSLASDLPEASAFDMVCAFEVLEHIEDDESALREWSELIKPGGHLLLSVPAWQDLFGPWDKAVGHFRRYSPDELTELFRANGFEPVFVSLYGWPLAFVLEWIRNKVATGEAQAEDSVAEQTARSGRWLQPSKRFSDIAVRVGIVPFQILQRLVPGKGNGIVALARKL